MNSILFQSNTKLLGIVLIAIAVFISSCASDPRGPTYLIPKAVTAKGYKALGDRATFEKDGLVISINVLKPEDEIVNKTFKELKDKHFIFMELTFMNKSDKLVVYNSSFTSLRGAKFDYRKPLNYTDLYTIVLGMDYDIKKEKDLKKLNGKFYDHATRIAPKTTTKRYLIFAPNAKETYQAVLVMGEIYIGVNTLSVTFPFDTVETELPDSESIENL